jgi:hypothetical protein
MKHSNSQIDFEFHPYQNLLDMNEDHLHHNNPHHQVNQWGIYGQMPSYGRSHHLDFINTLQPLENELPHIEKSFSVPAPFHHHPFNPNGYPNVGMNDFIRP